MFVKYKYGAWKKEIRDLLRNRLKFKERIKFHERKIEHHQDKIKTLNSEILPEIEKKLEDYLKRAGN